MIEIAHPGFNFKFSLRDGSLHDNLDGQSVWRVFLTEKATANSISELGLLKLMKVFLAGVPLRISVSGVIENDGVWFWATLDYGTEIFCCISRPGVSFYHGSGCRTIIVVDFPLFCVRRILEVLDVHV